MAADRFFHVDVQFGHKRTCERLLEKFGHAGPLTFLLMLAVCKKSTPPGEFTYETEAAGWQLLGLAGYEPSFTLEEFFDVLGQYKQTRRTRRGRLTHVVCTQWGRWQKDWKREEARAGMRRKRAQSTTNNGVTPSQHRNNIQHTEIETEIDTPLPPNFDEEQTPLPTAENIEHVKELAAKIGIALPKGDT